MSALVTSERLLVPEIGIETPGLRWTRYEEEERSCPASMAAMCGYWRVVIALKQLERHWGHVWFSTESTKHLGHVSFSTESTKHLGHVCFSTESTKHWGHVCFSPE